MNHPFLSGNTEQTFDYVEKRMPLHPDMSWNAACVLMAEGNKSMLALLQLCAQTDRQIILYLDSMNMRGAQIWAAYAGFCGLFFPNFKECVLTRNPDMIAYVNKHIPQHTAVKNGAQRRR